MTMWSALRRPPYLALAAGVTVVLSYAYYYLSIRAAGDDSASLFNFTQFTTPNFVIKNWGIGYFAATVTLNVVIAAMTGILIAISVANFRTRRLAGVSSLGSIAIAAGTFTCPGCALPVTATLGLAIFGTSLPMFGLEMQIVTFAGLLVAISWLSRKMKHEYPKAPVATSDVTVAVPTG